MKAAGFNQDRVVLDYMYGKLNEAELGNMNPVQKSLALWGKNLLSSWDRSEFPVVSQVAGYLSGNDYDPRDSITKRIDAQYTFDATKNLKNAKSLKDYLVLNGIPAGYEPLVRQMIVARLDTITGKYDKK